MEAEKPSYAVYGNVCGCGRLDCPMVHRGGGGSRINLSAPPAMPRTALPHNLTNIKSRHGTKTPPISSAVRAPLSLPCNFLHLSLSLSCPRGRVLARRQQLHRYRLALARSHWIIPRNAPDRYPSHATWPISVYRHWATTQVALCLQNTEAAKD